MIIRCPESGRVANCCVPGMNSVEHPPDLKEQCSLKTELRLRTCAHGATALTEATVTTWYRALVDHLIGQWEGLRAAMARSTGGGGAVCDRDALTRDAACCAEAFSRLARFTRHHEHNQLARARPCMPCGTYRRNMYRYGFLP